MSWLKRAWLPWLTAWRTEHEMHPIRSHFTYFTLKHSPSTSAYHSTIQVPKKNQQVASCIWFQKIRDHSSPLQVKITNKVAPTLKGTPTRGTETSSRLVLHSLMHAAASRCAPSFPICIQMCELLLALLWLETQETELLREKTYICSYHLTNRKTHTVFCVMPSDTFSRITGHGHRLMELQSE